jgi:hypothetical protein
MMIVFWVRIDDVLVAWPNSPWPHTKCSPSAQLIEVPGPLWSIKQKEGPPLSQEKKAVVPDGIVAIRSDQGKSSGYTNTQIFGIYKTCILPPQCFSFQRKGVGVTRYICQKKLAFCSLLGIF